MADGSNPGGSVSSNARAAGPGGHSPQGRNYRELTGESLAETLDLASWSPADHLARQFDRIEAEISQARARETEVRRDVRRTVFPLLRTCEGAPRQAGKHEVTLTDLRSVQQALLFSGHVQAVDGASVVHETLPITIVQTAVVLANYLGQTGTWGHRIFQKDLRMAGRGALERALATLERRAQTEEQQEAGISDMLRRGLMAHAELNVLASEAKAPWRIGHGHPLPKELLTGTGLPELIELSLPVFDELLLRHKRFVFVPRASRDHLLRTIGGALRPLEYAIVQDLGTYLKGIIEEGHYGSGRFKHAKEMLDDFRAQAATSIVSGVFRVSDHSPAQVFYAHAEHAAEAAVVAMADSLFIETRGFPMLLDVAGNLCRGLFSADAVLQPAIVAHAGVDFEPGREADAFQEEIRY